MSRQECVKRRRAYEQQLRSDAKKSAEALAKIKKHFDTQPLGRESYPEAWGYVESLFPSLSEKIRNTKVYKNENTAFCASIGVPKEAGGLFFIKTGAILICWTRSFKDDVVIVHEMLHYCSQLLGSRFGNRNIEEDFAYLKSIRYLLSKGYDEKFIQEQYMLPHYLTNEYADLGHKPSLAERDECRERALARIKALYDQELNPPPPEAEEEEDDLDRFDFIN
jgi:hypothetical protein